MTSNEPATVSRVAAETRRAETVVRRESPDLLKYFERRCSTGEAPDLLGETLLVAWRRISAMPVDDQEARMWLFGVARRVLATSRRSGVRRQALVDRMRDEVASRPVKRIDEHDALHAALNALPETDSEIIRLLHWDGFTLTEIARHLNRPAGTIRSRYSRARSALRTALTD